MTAFPTVGLSIVVIMFTAVCVSANPSMLPKHEGYPMGKATDPVTGKSLGNDPGQKNATGAKALELDPNLGFYYLRARWMDPDDSNANDARVLEKPGAGVLPKVEGPQIKIEPPVKEATRTPANPGE